MEAPSTAVLGAGYNRDTDPLPLHSIGLGEPRLTVKLVSITSRTVLPVLELDCVYNVVLNVEN